MATITHPGPYAARLDIDYPGQLDRVSTFFRLVWVIPIAIVLGLLTGGGQSVYAETGERIASSGGGIAAALTAATGVMIVVRQRYPRWWFDFSRELTRFGARVGAYVGLMTDRYPSTVEEQSIHLQLDYPNARQDLNRWLPLVKWFLAIPHYVVLAVLWIAAAVAVLVAWFAILFTGHYPRRLFDFVEGVARWNLRVSAYGFLLLTDQYPPFSLK